MVEHSPPDAATIRTRLQRYGLSETAAKTYLAVIEHGSATASTVAETAGVSTSYVYDVCDTLESDGFVVVEDHRTPTRIAAVPPEDAFGRLQSDLESLEAAVTARYERGSTEDTTFEVVKSRQTIEKRLVSHIDAADSEVVLQLPAPHLSAVADALARARDRGVLVLLSVNRDPDPGPTVGGETPAAGVDLSDVASVVRTARVAGPALLAVDQQRGFVSPPTMLGWDHDQHRAITFRQAAVAAVLIGSYLGNYWPIGEERLVARPPALPLTSRMFRPAVFAAALQLRAGRDVAVDLYARPVGTDDAFETIDATVVDVRQNLVTPTNSDFGFENALVVDTGSERVSVGGFGAFLEDYECKQVTVKPA